MKIYKCYLFIIVNTFFVYIFENFNLVTLNEIQNAEDTL